MTEKIAIVTGASQGIGRETAIKLAEAGYNVAINYLSNHDMAQDTLRQMQKSGGKHVCLRCDMRKVQDIASMMGYVEKNLGVPELLVNNAGITKHLPFLEATEELWDDVNFTNWKGPYFCTQMATKAMIRTGIKGLVINITSIHQDCCFPISNIYGPAKAALNKFTKHAALELAQYGIRVVSIAPGCIEIREGVSETARGKMLASRIPLGRYGCTSEIAETVVWLASGKPGYITGSCIDVNGGALLPSHLENMFTANPFAAQTE